MADILESADPWGRRIILTDDRWTHIARRHPELVDRLSDLRRAVSEPTLITRAPKFPNGRNFYRALGDQLLMKVCVRYRVHGTPPALVGLIFTTHLTTRISKGEQRLWP